MSLTEYICLDCDKIFSNEQAREHPDTHTIACPVCGSENWEELPEKESEFLEDLFHTPA